MADHPTPTGPTPRRALIVDDDELNRRAAGALCRRLGLTPEMTPDGASALAALADRPFDIVLLDDRLPGLDGPGVARELRRREAAPRAAAGASVGDRVEPIALVGVTGSVLPEDRDRLLAAGMDAVLAKPLLEDELRAVVRDVLPGDRPARTEPIPAGG